MDESGTSNNGGLANTLLSLFQTGATAYVDSQYAANTYTVNNPSGLANNGQLAGVPGQSSIAISAPTTYLLVGLIAVGVLIFAIRK